MPLSHLRILLVGASGGIGQAMVQALQAQGAHVVPVGRRWPQGMPAGAISADIVLPQDRQRLVEVVREHNLNTVVMAAGVASFKPVEQLTDAEVTHLMAVNANAPMQLTAALLPHLLTLPHAQLVLVGSVLGHIGLPGHALYGASKSALHGFAEALRRELTGTPLRVQWLAPRATQTDFNDDLAQAFNRLTGTKSDSVGVVAQALVELLRSSSAERVLGWPERLGVRLNACLGAGMDRAFAAQAHLLRRLFSVKP
jgi:short-subunit dehydrogenase